jgi:hypothetical protein
MNLSISFGAAEHIIKLPLFRVILVRVISESSQYLETPGFKDRVLAIAKLLSVCATHKAVPVVRPLGRKRLDRRDYSVSALVKLLKRRLSVLGFMNSECEGDLLCDELRQVGSGDRDLLHR